MSSVVVGAIMLLAAIGAGVVLAMTGLAVGVVSAFNSRPHAWSPTAPPAVRVDAGQAAVIADVLSAEAPLRERHADVLRRVLPHVAVPFDRPADGRWTHEAVRSQLLNYHSDDAAAATTQPVDSFLDVAALVTRNGGITIFGRPATAEGWISAERRSAFFQRHSGGSISVWRYTPEDATDPRLLLVLLLVAFALTIAAVVLAIVLLAAGVKVLRQSPEAVPWHRRWTLWTLGLAVACGMWTALAGVLLVNDRRPDVYVLPDGTLGATGRLAYVNVALVAVLVAAVVAAYPAVVLRVLRLKADSLGG